MNVVQEAFQTCNPCSGSRVTLALFWREGDERPSYAQGFSQPPTAPCGLGCLTKDLWDFRHVSGLLTRGSLVRTDW